MTSCYLTFVLSVRRTTCVNWPGNEHRDSQDGPALSSVLSRTCPGALSGRYLHADPHSVTEAGARHHHAAGQRADD